MPIYFDDRSDALAQESIESQIREMIEQINRSINHQVSELHAQGRYLTDKGEHLVSCTSDEESSALIFAQIQGNTWKVDVLIAEIRMMIEVRDHLVQILTDDDPAPQVEQPAGSFGSPLPTKKRKKGKK